MAKQRHIRWKAFIMLVSFAASFTVFCHCQAAAVAAAAAESCCQRSCCEKKAPQQKDRGCQGMQAVKLNLQDKQAATDFHLEAVPMVLVEGRGVDERVMALREKHVCSDFLSYKLCPDRHSFYKCFVI